jgi:tetratricopeptide (TPR) repeat protein
LGGRFSRILGLTVLAATAASAHPGLHHDIDRASEAIEREPNRADLYVERAFLERLDTRLDDALKDLDRAGVLEPGNRRVHAERGMTLSAGRRDRAADAELTRFLEGGEATAATLAERARVRERLGRDKESIEDFTHALALRPDLEIYLARGALEESLGSSDAASRGYREGLERLGGALNLRLALIRLDTSRRAFDEALALVDEGMAAATVKTDWVLRRADVLEAAGRKAAARAERERALVEAERVLETHPSGIHLVSRAKAYIALGREDDARRDLGLALEKAPRYTEARDLLAGLAAGKP